MDRHSEIFSDLMRSVVFERNQGLDFEARHLLPLGWTLECRDDGYLFTGSWSDEWEDIVWKLVRFLSFKSMLAVSRSGVGEGAEYVLVTCTAAGIGFRAVFRCSPVRG